MSIGVNDLDPSVSQTLIEFLSGVTKPIETASDEDKKNLRAAISKQRWYGAGWLNFVPVIGAFASVMAGIQLSGQPLLMSSLFGLSFLFSGVSLWHTSRRDLMGGFQTNLPSEVLLATLPVMNLSPLERLYAKTVGLLIGEQQKMDESSARNILQRLNELLTNNRQLEDQRVRLEQALAHHSPIELEAERNQFAQRLGETTDPATQQAIQQSLQMCESRLADAQSMEQHLQRVAAQQEAVHQTLASTQSALARMQTTPSLASPAVEEIAEAVTQINLQTQAVEQAVQEVAVLTGNR